MAQNQIWIGGAVDTRFEPAMGYMEIVPDRRRVTLAAMLNRILNANSVVHTDMWRGFLNLPAWVPACVVHDTVNHTYNFIDPQTGAHTQVTKTEHNT